MKKPSIHTLVVPDYWPGVVSTIPVPGFILVMIQPRERERVCVRVCSCVSMQWLWEISHMCLLRHDYMMFNLSIDHNCSFTY